MSTPFYVSPEQLMKDRADFARKGIARGRSVAALQYVDGVLFVAENPSQALHKVSEIYDRIAFAAVGRYNEFENLRIAGVRLADMRGYAYDRRDVTGRGLANAYAQTLGTIFSSGGEKPYEVEIFVAEVGAEQAEDQIYRLTYDGQVADQHGYAVMGGQAELVSRHLAEHYTEGATLEDALHVAVAALGRSADDKGRPVDRVIPVADLEVAVLDRTRSQARKFARIRGERLTAMLADRGPEQPDDAVAEDAEPGAAPTDPSRDHPADPTDQVSGDTPPLEHPVTGGPARPPVAPPPVRPSTPSPVDPAQPPTPAPEPAPAPGPDPARPSGPPDPPPADPTQPRPGEPGEI